mgnify:CR=1 FL=1
MDRSPDKPTDRAENRRNGGLGRPRPTRRPEEESLSSRTAKHLHKVMVVGREVEGYRIQEVIGKGGMGVVYKAEDLALSRSVALKRIAPSFANDKAFLRRFRSEAQALARIDSPYIVSVHALLETDIGLLLVMEYVDGGTLGDATDGEPMDWIQARPLIKQTLQALEDAHQANVIHRDIKPSNIMLSAEDTVKVTDFGLAKVHRGDTRATVTQGVHGTLNYMSPEQVRGDADLDHRSDLYSLGMTVYEMLVGELPFEEDSGDFSKMRMIVEEEVPRPNELRPDVPDEVSNLVARALEKDPEDRFQSARAMQAAVDAVGVEQEAPTTVTGADITPAAHTRTDTHSRIRVAGIGFLIVLLTIGGYLMYDMMMAGGDESPVTEKRGAPPPGPSTTVAVETSPTGATVHLGGREIGVTPLADTVTADSAQVRVQKAGFTSVDTTLALGSRQTVDLHLTLPRESSPPTLAVATDPSGATVYIDGDSVGVSPFESTVDGAPATVRVVKDGHVSVDTVLHPKRGQRTRLRLTLPDVSREARPPPQGTYRLSVKPAGTVVVDGQPYGNRASVELPVGRHSVQFRHPDYGTVDTTVTVHNGQNRTLTCHFEQTVRIRSPDKPGHVSLSGTRTGASTPHTISRGPGTYRVGLHLPQNAPHSVAGGTYLKTVNDQPVESEEFSGRERELTLEPSFVPETHVLTFRVRSLLKQVRAHMDRLKRKIQQAIQEQDWEILPTPLAESCKRALSALYAKHEIETVRVVSNEMRQEENDVVMPFDVYVTYHQKGREGSKAIPLSLTTRWRDQNGDIALVDVQRTDVDRN